MRKYCEDFYANKLGDLKEKIIPKNIQPIKTESRINRNSEQTNK